MAVVQTLGKSIPLHPIEPYDGPDEWVAWARVADDQAHELFELLHRSNERLWLGHAPGSVVAVDLKGDRQIDNTWQVRLTTRRLVEPARGIYAPRNYDAVAVWEMGHPWPPIPGQSGPCPDCRGSGRYVGLVVVEACRGCRGSGVAAPVDPAPPAARSQTVVDQWVWDNALKTWVCQP